MALEFFACSAEFRKWLEENHQKETVLLVGFYWVMSAKQEATRVSRLEKLINASESSQRIF